MALLGYEPRRLYAGRGAFESMGAGLAMAPGDIAFKCNFATLDTATGLVLSAARTATLRPPAPR